MTTLVPSINESSGGIDRGHGPDWILERFLRRDFLSCKRAKIRIVE